MTAPFGTLHGMPIAACCGEPGLSGMWEAIRRTVAAADNEHQVGIGSIDRAERARLRSRDVHVVDMRSVDEFGVVSPPRHVIDNVRDVSGTAKNFLFRRF